jgi:signal transduction histidine kinase
VFRIVEEALRNIERHADAHQVRMSLQPLDDAADGSSAADPLRAGQARLTVEDDGCGFDPAHSPPGHYGLRGMQEQALLADARLTLASHPGAGTRVQLDFAL